jgi:hypothetical protein
MNAHEIRIRRAARLEGRRRRLKPNGDRCAICGLSDLRTLQTTRVVLCAHHRLLLQGLIPIEDHHIFGKDLSSFTVTLPANLHAVLTFMGLDYPPDASTDLKQLLSLRDWLEVAYEITNTEIERKI